MQLLAIAAIEIAWSIVLLLNSISNILYVIRTHVCALCFNIISDMFRSFSNVFNPFRVKSPDVTQIPDCFISI